MFAMTELISSDVQDSLKLLFSAGSLAVTAYFWFVRINRERVSLAFYPIAGFEGELHPGGIGQWSGRLYLANRSLLPSAVVAVKSEIWWDGRWLAGGFGTGIDSDLPWNLPPAQVFARDIRVAFDLGHAVTAEQIYAPQRLRLTFITVDGSKVATEIQTGAVGTLAAAA